MKLLNPAVARVLKRLHYPLDEKWCRLFGQGPEILSGMAGAFMLPI